MHKILNNNRDEMRTSAPQTNTFAMYMCFNIIMYALNSQQFPTLFSKQKEKQAKQVISRSAELLTKCHELLTYNPTPRITIKYRTTITTSHASSPGGLYWVSAIFSKSEGTSGNKVMQKTRISKPVFDFNWAVGRGCGILATDWLFA